MSILNWLSARKVETSGDADLRAKQAIELAFLGIDARLRLVKGSERRLRPAVESALKHCSALAAAIPGPIDLIPEAWAIDPGLRALFAQCGEIDDLLGRSLELLSFSNQPGQAGVDPICAVISVVRTEQTVLGLAAESGSVYREMSQCRVSFARHRLLMPSLSEAQLRHEMEWRVYEHLVVEALGSLFRWHESEADDGRVLALLRERLELLQRTRAGLGALHLPPVADAIEFNSVRLQLIENGRTLVALRRNSGSLEDQFQRVINVLARPHEFVEFGNIEDQLTGLNVVAADEDDVAGKLHLVRIAVKGTRSFSRAASMVRVKRGLLKPRQIDYSAAERWL